MTEKATRVLLTVSAAWPALAWVALSFLGDLCFDASPSIPTSAHVLLGLLHLFGFGLVGTAVAVLGLYWALRTFHRVATLLLSVAISAVSLVVSVAHVWAGLMFLGLA